MSKPPSCTAGAVDLNKGVDEVLTHKDMWGLLKQVSIPADRDPQAPALKGATTLKLQLGLAGRRMQPPTLSKDSQRMPVLTARVFGWLRRCWPGAQVTSCTVAFNRMSPLHVDRNIGLSYLTGVGDVAVDAAAVAADEFEATAKDRGQSTLNQTRTGEPGEQPLQEDARNAERAHRQHSQQFRKYL